MYDPLRKKEVAATAEEKVRQWFIMQLQQTMTVPSHLMMSECGFKFGEKQYRADILIYDREGLPLAIVECKRPEVEIDAEVARQALRYNAVLSVKFLFLTNGHHTHIFARDGAEFKPYPSVPTYADMLGYAAD